MTLCKGLMYGWWVVSMLAAVVAGPAWADEPPPRAYELPSRLNVTPYDEDLAPGTPLTNSPLTNSPLTNSPLTDGSPASGSLTNPPPAFGRSLESPVDTFGEPVLSPPGTLPPCAICPDPAADSASHGRFRRFVERWSPEGVVPYWGRRTPDWRKDLGIGDPLPLPGWRGQPFSISGFSGATNGGPLIRHRVHELPSYYGGVNFGWDYDHYWGIEKRLGFGALNLTNGRGQRLETGLSVTGEYRMMYYPLGDSRWRPFITTGIGWSDFYFRDDVNHQHLDTLFLFPFGVGIKYLWRERWALRIDLIDELTFGSHVTSTFHYVALTAGLEFRYGQRLLKFPWSRHL
ncbi:MAG TPA: hypothetical protein VFW87_19030 [Pirellulales bacterium]|nr:hypothetical protein [Pirellulales bacterium]